MSKTTAKNPPAGTIYDAMMGGINGDLTSANIKESLKPRDGESDTDYRMRLDEYAAALFVMDLAMKELAFDDECEDAFLRAQTTNKAKSEAQIDEQKTMKNLEDQFSSDND